MAENYSAVDFSGLSATSDGNTLLYADNQVCKSDKTLGQLIDGKIDGKGYATESFVTGKIEDLSGTVSTEYATKEELGKVGNFIVTEGDDEGRPTLNPSEAETKSIYLVKDEHVATPDQYREWIVTENEGTKAWNCIGDTSMDLSDYALSADVDAGLALKEDKVFVAEYNVTPYADIKAAWDNGKTIICKYQPSPQGNPGQIYYIRSMQYVPYAGFMFGAVTSILGFDFITVHENNGWNITHSLAYDKTTTSGKQELTDAFNTKQDVDTLMNNINIDVGSNNLALSKENGEIQNIHWSTKNFEDETIEQDIVISDMPFAWYGYRDTQGQVQTNTIKLTFAHNLDYYESIILSIDVNGSPIARADVDITHVAVNDTIANWYNIVYIRVKELGDNYIVIGQDGQGPKGYIYNLTTTPETISKIIISTNDVSCISKGHSFVGGINSSALNDCNMAFGNNAIASGTGSVAIGEHTLAIGYNARSIGLNSKASGYCSFAEGCQTSAFGQDSHAEGYETVTNSYNNNGGEGAHAEGFRTSAINCGHAEGYLSIASANESRGIPHAEGYKTSAFIAVTYPFAAAHAEGNCTIASGLDSHAEGNGTSAIGEASHAEGQNTIAGAGAMHVGGIYNKTSANAAFVIGNGYDNDNRSDSFIVDWNGIASATKLATSGIPDVESKITNLETTIGNIETILQSI